MVKLNLAKLKEAETARLGSEFRHEDWALKAGVGKGTVGRTMRAETAPRIDTLESLGAPFGLAAWQLLAGPLDVVSPPELMTDEIRKELTELRAMRVQLEALTRGESTASDGDGHPVNRQSSSQKQGGATRP
jgi:hypothetical protein